MRLSSLDAPRCNFTQQILVCDGCSLAHRPTSAGKYGKALNQVETRKTETEISRARFTKFYHNHHRYQKVQSNKKRVNFCSVHPLHNLKFERKRNSLTHNDIARRMRKIKLKKEREMKVVQPKNGRKSHPIPPNKSKLTF